MFVDMHDVCFLGQFGKVFKATLQRGMEPISVAVKTVKKMSASQKEEEEFRREMNVMSQMIHPNIVQLYGLVKDGMAAQLTVSFLFFADKRGHA